MSDKTEDAAATPKKKGKLKKILVMGAALVVLVGGGMGAGLYASSSGMIGGGGGHADAAKADEPHLVPKAEEKRASAGGGEGEEGGHGDVGDGEEASAGHGGTSTPKGTGGDKYASTYFALEKEFTSNLKESTHFIQVGVAVSTPYDERVIENLKTHEIAIRSAILLTLGETEEDSVFTSQGKTQLQRKLVDAINATLKQKDGFGGISNVYFTSFVVQ